MITAEEARKLSSRISSNRLQDYLDESLSKIHETILKTVKEQLGNSIMFKLESTDTNEASLSARLINLGYKVESTYTNGSRGKTYYFKISW